MCLCVRVVPECVRACGMFVCLCNQTMLVFYLIRSTSAFRQTRTPTWRRGDRLPDDCARTPRCRHSGCVRACPCLSPDVACTSRCRFSVCVRACPCLSHDDVRTSRCSRSVSVCACLCLFPEPYCTNEALMMPWETSDVFATLGMAKTSDVHHSLISAEEPQDPNVARTLRCRRRICVRTFGVACHTMGPKSASRSINALVTQSANLPPTIAFRPLFLNWHNISSHYKVIVTWEWPWTNLILS